MDAKSENKRLKAGIIIAAVLRDSGKPKSAAWIGKVAVITIHEKQKLPNQVETLPKLENP